MIHSIREFYQSFKLVQVEHTWLGLALSSPHSYCYYSTGSWCQVLSSAWIHQHISRESPGTQTAYHERFIYQSSENTQWQAFYWEMIVLNLWTFCWSWCSVLMVVHWFHCCCCLLCGIRVRTMAGSHCIWSRKHRFRIPGDSQCHRWLNCGDLSVCPVPFGCICPRRLF